MGCEFVILLDTHVLIWLDSGDPRLGETALTAIDKAFKENTLFVSAISFWEVAMLIEKKRLEISVPAGQWRKQLLDNGLQEIVLKGDIAIQSANLPYFHGDPADRIIVASALNAGIDLCTADKKILAWKSPGKWIDARR